MDMSNLMDFNEFASGKAGRVFMTIADRRLCLANARSIEATATMSNTPVSVMGKRQKVNRPGPLEFKVKASLYYNNSVFVEAAAYYKDTGKLPYCEMQIINDDAASTIGVQEVILLGLIWNSYLIAKLDVTSDEPMTEDIEGTYDDFLLKRSFDLPKSMIV